MLAEGCPRGRLFKFSRECGNLRRNRRSYRLPRAADVNEKHPH